MASSRPHRQVRWGFLGQSGYTISVYMSDWRGGFQGQYRYTIYQYIMSDGDDSFRASLDTLYLCL